MTRWRRAISRINQPTLGRALARHRPVRPRRAVAHDLRLAQFADLRPDLAGARGDLRHDARRRRRLFRRHRSTGVITRLIDLLLAFPELLLAIIIAAALGGGFWNVVVVIADRLRAGLCPRRPGLDAGGASRSPISKRRSPSGVSTPHDHLPARAAQHLGAHRGADDAVDRIGHPARGVAELPRHRHAAAQPELGQHHPRRAEQHLRLPLADHRRGLRDHDRRPGLQPDRRRGARRPRSGDRVDDAHLC